MTNEYQEKRQVSLQELQGEINIALHSFFAYAHDLRDLLDWLSLLATQDKSLSLPWGHSRDKPVNSLAQEAGINVAFYVMVEFRASPVNKV